MARGVWRKEDVKDAKQAEAEEDREPRRSHSREQAARISLHSEALFDISFYPSIVKQFILR